MKGLLDSLSDEMVEGWNLMEPEVKSILEGLVRKFIITLSICLGFVILELGIVIVLLLVIIGRL